MLKVFIVMQLPAQFQHGLKPGGKQKCVPASARHLA